MLSIIFKSTKNSKSVVIVAIINCYIVLNGYCTFPILQNASSHQQLVPSVLVVSHMSQFLHIARLASPMETPIKLPLSKESLEPEKLFAI